ncbi:MAG TPA: MarC family protein [Kofleriaceae bacterium]|nr:MarC family protein [Kofleriaceae bacterium]
MTEDNLKFAVVALSAMFFVIDPIANVPIFLTITAQDAPAQRRRIALRAAAATWLTLCIFALAGGLIFQAFGISLGAFKIAGGIMLLLMSVDMMRAQPSPTRTTAEEQGEASETARDDIAIFPLAVPMLAGPGAIATVMVLMSRAAWHPVRTTAVFVAVTVTCLAAWLLMRSAASAEKLLPKTLLRAFERIMGLLLAAVAVEFVAGGVRDIVHGATAVSGVGG